MSPLDFVYVIIEINTDSIANAGLRMDGDGIMDGVTLTY